MAFGLRKQAEDRQKEADSEGGGSNSAAYRYELNLIDTEVATVRFIGADNEPYLYDEHGFSQVGDDYDRARCMAVPANPVKGIAAQPCDACIAHQSKNYNASSGKYEYEQRVKQRSPRAAFTVLSLREVLLIPDVRKSDNQPYFRREPVRKNRNGQHIFATKGVTSVYPGGIHPEYNKFRKTFEGLKIWSGSLSQKAGNADAILALDNKVQQLCCCGGKSQTIDPRLPIQEPATVVTDGWTCSDCGEPVSFDTINRYQVRCLACNTLMMPDELVRCTGGCTKPKRGDLALCFVRVERKGVRKDTTYQFEYLMPFAPLIPEHHGLTVDERGNPFRFDFDKLYPRDLKNLHAAMTRRGIPIPSLGQSASTGGGGGGPPQGGGAPLAGGAPGGGYLPTLPKDTW